ncbi:hypothetical protein L9F63_019066, partial [Diploptera punctata]
LQWKCLTWIRHSDFLNDNRLFLHPRFELKLVAMWYCIYIKIDELFGAVYFIKHTQSRQYLLAV